MWAGHKRQLCLDFLFLSIDARIPEHKKKIGWPSDFLRMVNGPSRCLNKRIIPTKRKKINTKTFSNAGGKIVAFTLAFGIWITAITHARLLKRTSRKRWKCISSTVKLDSFDDNLNSALCFSAFQLVCVRGRVCVWYCCSDRIKPLIYRNVYLSLFIFEFFFVLQKNVNWQPNRNRLRFCYFWGKWKVTFDWKSNRIVANGRDDTSNANVPLNKNKDPISANKIDINGK